MDLRAGAALGSIAATLLVAGGCSRDGARLDGPATDAAANVLIVTLDTTRADRIGCYGSRTVETPHLDALARSGVRFAQAISSIPLTLPAHSSLMTGSNPLHHRVRDNGGFFLAPERTTLAEVLAARGFSTAAFIGAFVLNRHWGLAQGFAVYDDEFGPDDPRAAADLHEQRDGAESVAHALAWWDAHRGERFFVWIHLYDPHYPYEPPGEFAERYRDRPYDGEIAYTDTLVGRLFDGLRERGLWDETLVVVIGDHGEGLGEHDEPDHGIFLYDSTLHVPLIVRTPQDAYRGVVADVVRETDVMPTILEYLELPVPDSVRGASLLPLMAGESEDEERWVYSESAYVRYHYGWKDLAAVRGSRFKLVELPRPELYDLVEDPGETKNLASERPETVAALREILVEIRAQADAPAGVQMPEDVDPEALARLAALGYLATTVNVPEDQLADPKDKRDVLDVLIRASRLAGEALKSGRYAEAAATVEEAVRREPNFMDGYMFLGTLYSKLGRPDDAIRALEQVLAVNPESAQARLALAKVYAATKDHAAALGLAEAVIAGSPTHVSAYYTAADALAALGRPAEAVRKLRRLLELRPDATGAEHEIGRLLLQQGRLDEARSQIERALAVAPETRSAHFNLALIAEERGDLERARVEYERELERYPDHVEALTNLGILHMRRKDAAAGVAAFERLVAAAPGDALAHHYLARALLAAGGDRGRALELARRSVALDPGNPRFVALARELER